jgi:hypothetical protein
VIPYNALSSEFANFETPCIICFKIKNPPPVELCWQKKEIPRIGFIFLGWPNLPPKFDSLSQISNYENASKNMESFNH